MATSAEEFATNASVSDIGMVVLGSLLYIAGSSIQYVTPAYLGELKTLLDLSEAQMGFVPATENGGIALASLLSILWLRTIDCRVLAIAGALICSALNVIAFFARNVELLLVLRLLIGVLGEGILFSLAFIVLGLTRDPDRSFGMGLTTVVAFISAALVLGFAAGGFVSGLAISAAGYSALVSVVSISAVSGMGVLTICFRVPRFTAAAESQTDASSV